MRIELHGVEPHERKALSVKVQEYQEKNQAFSDKLENSVDAPDHSFIRDESLARDRKKDTTFRLMGTTDKLNEAKQSAAEIEEVAVTITEALRRNRNQIEDTHVKVKSVIDSQRHGGSIIRRMLSRDRRQRVALFGLAAILIIAFLLTLYFKFGHRSPKEDSRIHPDKTL
uniref:Uncharacterized protein AlNc14C13G1539 n=1 Tax=Albugo laibachii Nc14 TaxID=890382 RepID=F0W3H6_9STRA|nr:conserved hypothetical protein [Albugo laibachii Nc14]CCA16321.1 conserved hypothetical protein [Albugo laibachii Nc14]|eukprot:CCA16321.1 conserved hypothetical protein [Albugo laibachii Nc14]